MVSLFQKTIFFFLVAYLIPAMAMPECRWMASDPICHAVCVPVVDPIQCIVSEFPDIIPHCVVQISNYTDSSPSDHCPHVTVVCESIECSNGPCEIQCPPPVASWMCSKPEDCPKPEFQLMCEHPACEYVPETFVHESDFGYSVSNIQKSSAIRVPNIGHWTLLTNIELVIYLVLSSLSTKLY